MLGPHVSLAAPILIPVATLLLSYAIGSIPWSYILVRRLTGEDITEHGTGNVGAMNVRRSTGSWPWFTVAMVLDAAKGFFPTLAAKIILVGAAWATLTVPYSKTLVTLWPLAKADPRLVGIVFAPMLAVAATVIGHNYSVWLAIVKKRYVRTGKGLATGGGALLAYDWRYFTVAVIVALVTIAITRYMMAGQVAAAISLPLYAIATRQPDWPFALLMGLVVYSAHHKRFVGMLRGKEPKLYTQDHMGPRG